MVITATVDRYENGNAVLLSDEIGFEINIPMDAINGTYTEGERFCITFDKDGNIKTKE